MLDIQQFQSEDIDQLAGALATAQGKFGDIPTNRTVHVTPKDTSKRGYDFSYSTLDVVLKAVTPALSENGLALVATVIGQQVTVRLLHKSGQFLGSTATARNPTADPQGFGSDLTYLRRYLTSALVNVCSEYDDDGNRGAGNDAVPVDPMQPLWDALDAIGIGPGASTQAWCEKTLGRKVPSVDGLSKDDVKTLLDAAKCLKATPPSTQPKGEPTGQPLATEQQCTDLNAALNKLHPWDQDAVAKLGPKDAAQAKTAAKLTWANGMLKLSKPIGGFRSLTNEEIKKLIECANNGEVPAPEPGPDWMDGEPQQRKE